jgi:hypothetical protein
MQLNISLKKALFPKISDWSSDYTEIKTKLDWWNLPNLMFIFFHPVGTKWFLLGVNVMLSLISIASCYFSIPYINWWAIIPGIISIFLIKSSIKKIKRWNKDNFTLYDIYLKE